jgi:hypothetical protein
MGVVRAGFVPVAAVVVVVVLLPEDTATATSMLAPSLAENS